MHRTVAEDYDVLTRRNGIAPQKPHPVPDRSKRHGRPRAGMLVVDEHIAQRYRGRPVLAGNRDDPRIGYILFGGRTSFCRRHARHFELASDW